jgi:hypothetical protein
MAYASSNPPFVILSVPKPTGGTFNIWAYVSADAKATVSGANYFTDALERGMNVGDLVFVSDTATPLISSHGVEEVSSNGATLSTGVDIGATT